MTLITFLIILAALILVHEFGHFFVAKKADIRVDEFGFGFPPRLWSKKRGETLYSFNLIPFGGYVKIFGERITDEAVSGPDSKRSFVNKNRAVQAAVLVAGVAANFLFAWLLLGFGFLRGMPASINERLGAENFSDVKTIITFVAPDSPAAKAGLKGGDAIVSVAEGGLFLEENKPEVIARFIEGKSLAIKVSRLNNELELAVAPEVLPGQRVPMIGIGMTEAGILKLPLIPAFLEGARTTLNLAKGTSVGFYFFLKGLFVGETSISDLTGPVGIAGLVGEARKLGLSYLISFTAFISVNLAILNLLPLPALDGGRLLFVLIESVSRRRIPARIANALNSLGFALLLALMVVVTYRDIIRLF